jgi:hypothetical protein
MSKELVRDYYAAFGENEWRRLTCPEATIEFAMKIIINTANDPSLLGASVHLLYIGEKR